MLRIDLGAMQGVTQKMQNWARKKNKDTLAVNGSVVATESCNVQARPKLLRPTPTQADATEANAT